MIRKFMFGFIGIFIGTTVAHAATCADGYDANASGDCVITCETGSYVATAGGPCVHVPNAPGVTYGHHYVDTRHTVKYGDTSEHMLKQCPRAASGSIGIINAHVETSGKSINECYLTGISGVRYTAQDRGTCVPPSSCWYETHGTARAACYYTTGADGAAIYDQRTIDPATGATRSTCVAGSGLDTCDAGWYDVDDGAHKGDIGPTQHPCQPVGIEYYSPAGDLKRYACPAGTATCGYGDCAASINDCKPIKTLKTSSGVSLALWSTQKPTPTLVVAMPDGTKWYSMSDVGARDNHINIRYNNTTYALIDPLDYFTEVTFSGRKYLVPTNPTLP